MQKDLILALDQGTTSSRAILFDSTGKALDAGQLEFTQYYPADGWVEQDAMEILLSQLTAAIKALDSGIDPGRIAAIGITNQRETTIVWDKRTGMPIHNAIVWQCRRTADKCRELEEAGLTDYIRQTTGLIPDAYFSGTKIAWLLDNVPGAREKAEAGHLLFGTVDCWLIWKLTGGKAHVTDYSNAARTMLFDIHKLCWDEKLCAELKIPMSMLPEAKPSSCVYGTVAPGIPGLEALAGVPIAGAAGDQQAALFGQACFQRGQAKCTYGTGCFLVMNTGEEAVLSDHKLLSTIAWGLDGKVEYALEGSVFNGGTAIQWLRDGLEIISSAPEINELAAQVPDAGGVFLVPAFTGLGAPYWNADARGLIAGITRATTKAHLARAVLEGIAFQVTDLVRAMEHDIGAHMATLKVDGGASRSDLMMQFQSDLLDADLYRPASVETTAFGAAALAGLAVGLWQDKEEIAALWKPDRVFAANMSLEERTRRYQGWCKAVSRACME